MNKWTRPLNQDDKSSPKVLVVLVITSIFAGALIAIFINK